MKSMLILFSSLLLVTHNHGYKVGDLATDVSLSNIDGKMVSLTDYDDAKGFIVIFTCNTCPYSVAYEDRIIALDKKYAPLGYPVIAINPNDPAAQKGEELRDMKQRAENKGFTFPYLQDKGQNVYPKFGATRTPHVFVLEKQDKGNVVQYIGAIDDSSRNPKKVKQRYVADAVDALLAGQLPKVSTTKAIGCSIKTL
jgi:peroxiredoxin